MSTAASRPACSAPPRSVMMGVAGSGKTTIGEAFAAASGATYLDGDKFHPPANIDKMSRGIPLTDDDRWPWLDRVALEMSRAVTPVVGGCSALKRVYRDRLRAGLGDDVLFIHLTGTYDILAARMEKRTGHFMPPSLLESQLAALEPLGEGENFITVDIAPSTDEIVASICAQLGKETA